jgi:hypothetical protein
MSTLKVAAIQNPSAATAAITLDANGGALIGGQAAYARNLVYNGAMQVAQRSASVTGITSSGYYTADRWSTVIGNQGTWTQTVENDSPTGSGFRKSLKMLCTTADASPASLDLLRIDQYLEGQDLQRIAKGTSAAQQLTLSFWVKSNVTGTYITELIDVDNSRSVSASYAISASATWEKKIIAFPADTTGALDNDNAASLRVVFSLGAGSDYTSGTLATTWGATTTANRYVGQTNLAAATDNYWQITGVQLEVGPVATPFEFKSFGQELRECQRYYWRLITGITQALATFSAYNTTNAYAVIDFPVTMRTGPTIDQVTGSNYFNLFGNNTIDAFDSFNTVDVSHANACRLVISSGITTTTGYSYWVESANAAARLSFSAEL